MSFDADEIERMPPHVREEIQAAEVVWHFARRRRQLYAERHPKKEKWPHAWHENRDPISTHFRRLRSAIPRS